MSWSRKPYIQVINSQIQLNIYVQPGAKKTEIQGLFNGALKVRLAEPAVENKANEELIHFLTKKLGVKKSDLHLIRGQKSRYKVIGISKEIDNIEELLIS